MNTEQRLIHEMRILLAMLDARQTLFSAANILGALVGDDWCERLNPTTEPGTKPEESTP